MGFKNMRLSKFLHSIWGGLRSITWEFRFSPGLQVCVYLAPSSSPHPAPHCSMSGPPPKCGFKE
uniref:Uncharacterized protein n=1 Tax=Aotus nancymaae TaxID=37293 RepID=A0A2K5EL26_AOTNA